MNKSRVPALTGPTRSLVGGLCALTVGAAAIVSLVAGVDPRPVAAAPGTPGTPQAPKILYTEDFENAPKTGAPQSLDAYSSASTQAPGEKYTADADWLNRSYCNGLLVSSTNTPAADDCGAQRQGPAVFGTLQAIATAMGSINGTGADNTAVGAYTENTTPFADNQIEFSTVDQLSLTAASGRFLTFSVNAAAANCNRGVTDPKLRFYFKKDDGTLAPVSTSAIDPCEGDAIGFDPGGRPVRGGQFPANGSLLAGSTVGIVMKNENGSGAGNDGAFDDIKVLDGTPQLDKSFSPASIVQGTRSTLTFTVTNTTDLAAKNGWSFRDSLPANVTATGTNSTTCSGATVTAADGATAVTGSGNLNAGQTSCTVSVEVTSNTVGTYSNTGCAAASGSSIAGCAPNVTTTGLNPPGSATLVVTPSQSSPATSDPATSDPTTSDPTTSDPTTSDPATSDPTPNPTTTDATTSDPASDPATAGDTNGSRDADANRGSQDELATTGAGVGDGLVLGSLSILLGIGAVLLARRRPRHG